MKKYLFCLIFFLSLIGIAHATDRYAANAGGASSGACPVTAKCTLAYAQTQMLSGDRLILDCASGTSCSYTTTITNSIGSGASNISRKTITVAAGKAVTIAPSTNIEAIGWGGLQYLTVDGTLLGGSLSLDMASSNANGLFVEGNFFEFKNFELKNVVCPVMGISGTANNSLLDNLNVHDIGMRNLSTCTSGTGPAQSYGFYQCTQNTIIRNSRWYNISGHGMQLYHDTGQGQQDCWDNTVEGNIIHDVGGSGIFSGGSVIRSTIRNNLIYNATTGFAGIMLTGAGNKVYNNTIYHTIGGACIELAYHNDDILTNNMCSDNTLDNRIVLLDANNAITGPAANQTTNLTGSQPAANHFTNAAGGDFTLKSTSSAVNAGTNLASTGFNTDIVNNLRGTQWDIGAYEFAGVAPPVLVVAITSPNSGNPVTVNNSSQVIGGTISAAATVSWSNNRGGSGTATVTTSTWSATIPAGGLKSGVNTITVSATNGVSQVTDTQDITYAPTFPGNSLVAAYGFEEGAVSTATDSSPIAANTGTLVNTPTRTTGHSGQGITLNGSNQYISVNDANALDLTQSFTLSAWVQPAAPHTNFQAVIAKGGPVYRLYATINSSVGGGCADSAIGGFVQINGASVGTSYTVCDNTPIPPGQWSHLAVTYNNATAQLKLYKNGALMQTVSVSGYMEQTTGTLLIGRSEFASEFFQGVIDEVRVYNWAIPQGDGVSNNDVNSATCFQTASVNTPSIFGDRNCPVIPTVVLAPPLQFRIGATSTFKLGATSSFWIGAQ